MRDAARYGVMAVGMTFVIVNKDLDLSVGSLYGLTAAVFAVSFAPSYFNSGLVPAIAWTLAIGLFVGLVNGVLVTILRVPAFIATLTMLFIGRGIVTGVSGGKTISFLSERCCCRRQSAATRLLPRAATSLLRPIRAFRPPGCECAPICCRPSARRLPA